MRTADMTTNGIPYPRSTQKKKKEQKAEICWARMHWMDCCCCTHNTHRSPESSTLHIEASFVLLAYKRPRTSWTGKSQDISFHPTFQFSFQSSHRRSRFAGQRRAREIWRRRQANFFSFSIDERERCCVVRQWVRRRRHSIALKYSWQYGEHWVVASEWWESRD